MEFSTVWIILFLNLFVLDWIIDNKETTATRFPMQNSLCLFYKSTWLYKHRKRKTSKRRRSKKSKKSVDVCGGAHTNIFQGDLVNGIWRVSISSRISVVYKVQHDDTMFNYTVHVIIFAVVPELANADQFFFIL